MINIAVIDDDVATGYELEKYLGKACDKLQIKSETDIYSTGEKFCEALETGETYNLIFLDIELCSSNGVEIGKYIREEMRNNQMQIVYISAKQDYAMQLFQIRPMDFMIKPVSEEVIYNCVKKYSDIFSGKDYFYFKTGKLNVKVSYDSVVFFESENRIVRIHTVSDVMECYTKLSVIEPELPDFFKRIHKSYIINPNYIVKYSAENVTMSDGSVLSVSRKYRKPFADYMVGKYSMEGEDFFNE